MQLIDPDEVRPISALVDPDEMKASSSNAPFIAPMGRQEKYLSLKSPFVDPGEVTAADLALVMKAGVYPQSLTSPGGMAFRATPAAQVEQEQAFPSEIKPKSYARKFHELTMKRSGLTPEAGPIRTALGAALYPINTAFELANLPENLLRGYEPGEAGTGLGDVLAGAAAATAPFGRLPVAGMRGADLTRTLKMSGVKGVIKDISEAVKRGEGGLIDPYEALKEVGIGGRAASKLVTQIKGNDLLEAVQNYQGSLRELTKGVTTEAKVIQKAVVAEMAQDSTFSILKSLGVPDDAAKVF